MSIIQLALTDNDLAQLRSCPCCGYHSLEARNTHTACYSIVCLQCEEDGYEVEVTGRSYGRDRPSSELTRGQHRRALNSAIFAWNRRT